MIALAFIAVWLVSAAVLSLLAVGLIRLGTWAYDAWADTKAIGRDEHEDGFL